MIAFRLAAGQALIGHEVHLACYSTPRREDAVFANVPCRELVRIHEIDRETKLEFITGGVARRVLRRLIPSMDAVHLHSVWESILRVAAAECRRAGVPYVVLLNGMLDPWSLSQSRLKKQLALRLGYRPMLDGAAALHLGNTDEQNLIKPLGLRAPGVIIPNGVFVQEIEPLPEPGQFRRSLPEIGDHRFVLFLSRLHYKKGLDVLASAFAEVCSKMPDVHLVVAGPDGGEQPRFTELVNSLGISGRVHITGPLYGGLKSAAMVDAYCFCLPSRQEGFSVAITEALAVGCPAVVTENCHFPEISSAGAGEVVPLDSSAVARGLLRLLANPSLRDSMSRAAKTLIAGQYTWEKIAQRAVQAYGTKGVHAV